MRNCPRQFLARPVITIAISYEGEAKANILYLLGSYALMIGTLASSPQLLKIH